MAACSYWTTSSSLTLLRHSHSHSHTTSFFLRRKRSLFLTQFSSSSSSEFFLSCRGRSSFSPILASLQPHQKHHIMQSESLNHQQQSQLCSQSFNGDLDTSPSVSSSSRIKIEEITWDHSFVRELPGDTREGGPVRQVVKARSSRISSKKQPKNWQDKSILAPSNGENEIKGSDFSRSADIAEDAPLLPSRKDIESETRVNAADAPSNSKRGVILKACVTTCTAIFAVAVVIQRATHLAAESGWSVPDSTLLLEYNVESWHLEVILGLVVVVSICRQLLLKAWPEFLESSNIANKEVLGPLQLSDYVIVAALPAISEELLFRGVLLPLCGLDWKGVAITGLLFGVLHLTGGRKNAFAIWASIVGVLYGLGCLATHSVTVPMAAHSANNLIGALIWKWKQQERSPHGD